MTDLDVEFAWQMRRIRLTGVAGYLGPVRLPVPVRQRPARPVSPDRVMYEVLNDLAPLSKAKASPQRRVCACGRGKSALNERCVRCKSMGRSLARQKESA